MTPLKPETVSILSSVLFVLPFAVKAREALSVWGSALGRPINIITREPCLGKPFNGELSRHLEHHGTAE